MFKVKTYPTREALKAAMVEDVKSKIRSGIHLTYFRLEGLSPYEYNTTVEIWLWGKVCDVFREDYGKVSDWIPFRIDDIRELINEAMPLVRTWWEQWYPGYKQRYEKRLAMSRIYMQTFSQRIPPVLEELKIPYSTGLTRGGVYAYLAMPGGACLALKVKFAELFDTDLEERFSRTVKNLRDAFSEAQSFGLKIQPIQNKSCFKTTIPSWMLPQD